MDIMTCLFKPDNDKLSGFLFGFKCLWCIYLQCYPIDK